MGARLVVRWVLICLTHLTNWNVFRIINAMKKDNMNSKRSPFHVICALIALLLAGVVFSSCASAPENPAPPPPTTGTLHVTFRDAFDITRSVLNDDRRLVVRTVDTGGRFEAWERPRGLIFFQHVTILETILQEIGPKETKITMHLRAQRYSWGGLTLPAGWYPSKDIDTFLGEDVMNLIEKKAAEKAASEKT